MPSENVGRIASPPTSMRITLCSSYSPASSRPPSPRASPPHSLQSRLASSFPSLPQLSFGPSPVRQGPFLCRRETSTTSAPSPAPPQSSPSLPPGSPPSPQSSRSSSAPPNAHPRRAQDS